MPLVSTIGFTCRSIVVVLLMQSPTVDRYDRVDSQWALSLVYSNTFCDITLYVIHCFMMVGS